MNKETYYSQKKAYSASSGRLKRIIDLMPDSYSSVLDVGCGAGDLAKRLKEKGHEISGIDLSSDALSHAREHLKENFAFDIEGNDWPANLMSRRYDVIVVSEVIEHLFDPRELIKKLKPLLKKNGYFIITTPNVLFWKNRFAILFGKFEYQEIGIMDYGHIRFFTFQTVQRFFKELKMNIEQENHVYPNFDYRGLRAIGKLWPAMFAYQMIFKVR
jgi:2-polyprenyl-3-methyl-5-hydroxy-6-metoxy-1,4-benzoquinol methylase